MIQNITRVTENDILQHVKLSGQIPSALRAIVELRIILAKAQEIGLKIDVAELQKAADSFRIQHKLVTTQETLAWLQHHALSLDDLETLVQNTVISVKLAEYLFADKVDLYFAEQKLDLVQVVLYEVILNDPDLAMELFYAIEEQEITFADVVRAHHPDPELRRRGGYRGILRRKDLMPELSAAVFAAEPPQVLKPITTGKKTYLVFVEAVIQPILDNDLRSQLQTALFTTWLNQQVERVDWTKVMDPKLIPILPQ